jgi:hypothetical protein
MVTLFTEINGSLSNSNLSATAGIVSSKLQASGCRVTNSGAQNLADNALTAVTFDTETYDTDSYHSTGSNTSRLTAPTAGKYRMGGTVKFSVDTDDYALLGVRIRVNGSTIISDNTVDLGIGLTHDLGNTTLSTETEYQLAADDYVELCAIQDNFSNATETSEVSASSAPVFWISRIGA